MRSHLSTLDFDDLLRKRGDHSQSNKLLFSSPLSSPPTPLPISCQPSALLLSLSSLLHPVLSLYVLSTNSFPPFPSLLHPHLSHIISTNSSSPLPSSLPTPLPISCQQTPLLLSPIFFTPFSPNILSTIFSSPLPSRLHPLFSLCPLNQLLSSFPFSSPPAPLPYPLNQLLSSFLPALFSTHAYPRIYPVNQIDSIDWIFFLHPSV